MTLEQLVKKASNEWLNKDSVRQRYPTFTYYWHERYERVYNFVYRINENPFAATDR